MGGRIYVEWGLASWWSLMAIFYTFYHSWTPFINSSLLNILQSVRLIWVSHWVSEIISCVDITDKDRCFLRSGMGFWSWKEVIILGRDHWTVEIYMRLVGGIYSLFLTSEIASFIVLEHFIVSKETLVAYASILNKLDLIRCQLVFTWLLICQNLFFLIPLLSSHYWTTSNFETEIIRSLVVILVFEIKCFLLLFSKDGLFARLIVIRSNGSTY
jgi:hypothetical protein